MPSSPLALFTLLAAPLLLAAQEPNPASAPDGLSILQQMSQHYDAATSWYIEATEERTTVNEYMRDWEKTVIIGAESGRTYHYEGHSQTGSALHISDGATAWDFHPEEHAYVRQPAPAGGYAQLRIWGMNEQASMRAFNLRKDLAGFAKHYDAATRLPDEVVYEAGLAFPCYVVQVASAGRKGPKPSSDSATETLWIDRQTWAVRKITEHRDSSIMAGSVRIPITADIITRYSTVQFGDPLPSGLFHFDPPADAKLVSQFPDPIRGVDMTGRPAPDIQLVAAGGKRVPLSSYRGKPVLLDFWATWCEPCVESMPAIAQLDKEASPKGLVTLLVDEDEDEKTATGFLAQHHYTWPNTQDEGKLGDAFNKFGIPLTVLIDPNGKIAFYKAGAAETELRTAIAALGPEYASLAPAPKTPPACQTAAK